MKTIETIRMTLVLLIFGLMISPVIDGEAINATSFAGICVTIVLVLMQVYEVIVE